MSDKSLADIINLKEIVLTILNEYVDKDNNEYNRNEIADKIYERYKNSVKIISIKLLEDASKKRSTLQTFDGILGR